MLVFPMVANCRAEMEEPSTPGFSLGLGLGSGVRLGEGSDELFKSDAGPATRGRVPDLHRSLGIPCRRNPSTPAPRLHRFCRYEPHLNSDCEAGSKLVLGN